MSSGRLIAFEGVEGAGKSTQIQRAAAALRSEGHRVETTAEPGGTALGAELRKLVLRTDGPVPLPRAELFLYLADRAQHIGEVIAPALAAGALVLSDRFSGSTIAYQAYGRGLDLDAVRRADALARNGVAPELTLLLDCPVGTGLGRARGDDRLHGELKAFHERVRAGFHAQAAAAASSWRTIDTTAPEDEVHAAVMAAIRGCLCT